LNAKVKKEKEERRAAVLEYVDRFLEGFTNEKTVPVFREKRKQGSRGIMGGEGEEHSSWRLHIRWGGELRSPGGGKSERKEKFSKGREKIKRAKRPNGEKERRMKCNRKGTPRGGVLLFQKGEKGKKGVRGEGERSLLRKSASDRISLRRESKK